MDSTGQFWTAEKKNISQIFTEYRDNSQFRKELVDFFKSSRDQSSPAWKQESVAAEAGVSVKTMTRFETGIVVSRQSISRILNFAQDEWGDEWFDELDDFRRSCAKDIENEHPGYLASSREGFSPRSASFRIITVFGAALVTALIGIAYFEFSQNRDERAIVDSQLEVINEAAKLRKEFDAQQAAQAKAAQKALENATPRMDDLILVPRFHANWGRGNVRVALREIAGLPDGANFETSTDGVTFLEQGAYADFRPGDKFMVRLVSHLWANAVGPYDFTEQAHSATTEALNDATWAGGASGFIKCFPAACEMTLNSFCNGNWSHLSLGTRLDGGVSRRFEFNDCPTDGMMQRICLSSPEFMFAMQPDQELFGGLYDKDGAKFDFSLKVSELRRAGMTTGEHLVELRPVTSLSTTPYTRAWFEIYHGRAPRFRVELAAGSCRGASLMLEDVFSKIYVDADGKGWRSTDLRSPVINNPTKEELKILFTLKNGKEFGPLVYEFDREEVMWQRIRTMDRPSGMKCIGVHDFKNRENSHHSCSDPKVGYNILNWASVDKILYGFDRDDLSEVIDINIGINEIDEYLDLKGPYLRNIFKVDLLPGQSELYFQYAYTDGTISRVEYLDLR